MISLSNRYSKPLVPAASRVPDLWRPFRRLFTNSKTERQFAQHGLSAICALSGFMDFVISRLDLTCIKDWFSLMPIIYTNPQFHYWYLSTLSFVSLYLKISFVSYRAPVQYKDIVLPIPIIDIRESHDRAIFIMGIPILVILNRPTGLHGWILPRFHVNSYNLHWVYFHLNKVPCL